VRWLAIAALGSGCFAPSPPTGAPCGSGGVCPTGLVCAGTGTCELHDIDAPPPPTWSIVQTGSTSMRTVSLDATGQGNLIVVAMQTNNTSTVDGVADDADNTYSAIPSATALDAPRGEGIEIWIANDSIAGATSVTASGLSVTAVAVWEVSNIRSASPLDTASVLDSQAATTTPTGAAITTTRAGDFVVAVTVVQNAVTSIHAGNAFTNDFTTRENGWAHLTDPAAPAGPYQAVWDVNAAGTYCASSAAFFASP
jgi:hypothetical protein